MSKATSSSEPQLVPVMAKKIKHVNDEARIEALEKSFVKLSTKAVIERKLRGNATMRCICQDAGVDITYAYGKKQVTLKS